MASEFRMEQIKSIISEMCIINKIALNLSVNKHLGTTLDKSGLMPKWHLLGILTNYGIDCYSDSDSNKTPPKSGNSGIALSIVIWVQDLLIKSQKRRAFQHEKQQERL